MSSRENLHPSDQLGAIVANNVGQNSGANSMSYPGPTEISKKTAVFPSEIKENPASESKSPVAAKDKYQQLMDKQTVSYMYTLNNPSETS